MGLPHLQHPEYEEAELKRRKKVSQALKGRKFSKETLEKMSIAKKGKARDSFTKEHCDNISNALKGYKHCETHKIGSGNIGRKHSKKARRNMSKAAAKRMEGKNPYSRANSEYVEGIRYKSGWEASFAKLLLKLGIKFFYELRWFEYEYKGATRRYLPDFKVKGVGYVEVKGWMKDKDEAKLNSMKRIFLVGEPEEYSNIRTPEQFFDWIKTKEWSGAIL
jgi:hypothetical protein